jgi:hypothetical protein
VGDSLIGSGSSNPSPFLDIGRAEIVETPSIETSSWDGFLYGEEIPTERVERANSVALNTAHQNSLPSQTVQSVAEEPNDISYRELFGQKVAEDQKIDTENSPFPIFSEAKEIPIEQDIAPQVEQVEREQRAVPTTFPTLPRREYSVANEYFDEDPSTATPPPPLELPKEGKSLEAENNSIFVEEAPPPVEETPPNVDNSFLAKVSDLKESVTEDNRDTLGFGLLYKTRSGDPGIDSLDTVVLPALDAHIYSGVSNHFFGHFNVINLSNGQITGDAINRYGASQGGNVESYSLAEYRVGYQYIGNSDSVTLEFGGLSDTVSPETANSWKIKYATKFDNIALDVAYVSKNVKDTMLSWIGDRYNYVDGNSTNSGVRGGVTKQGFEFNLKHSADKQVIAGGLNYYNVTGYNILDNEETSLSLLYLRFLDVPKIDTFMVGPIFIYDNYTYNTNHFTMGSTGYGNGGYFSPKNFILFGAYADLSRVVDESFFWKLKGNAGIVTFTNGADIWRSDSQSENITGFGYDIKAFTGYKLDDSVELLGGIGYQYAKDYGNLFFGLSAIYYFGKKSIEVNDLIYSNTLREMAE